MALMSGIVPMCVSVLLSRLRICMHVWCGTVVHACCKLCVTSAFLCSVATRLELLSAHVLIVVLSASVLRSASMASSSTDMPAGGAGAVGRRAARAASAPVLGPIAAAGSAFGGASPWNALGAAESSCGPGCTLGRSALKRRASRPPRQPASSDSTEYVPVAERGWLSSPPEVQDSHFQPHRLAKKKRRLLRTAASRRCRLLGSRLLGAFGRAAVDEVLAATQGPGSGLDFARITASRPAAAPSSPSSESTEYVPLADRGWKTAPPAFDDSHVQPHRTEKKRRRLLREAADRQVRALGARVEAAFGFPAVEELWALSAPAHPPSC